MEGNVRFSSSEAIMLDLLFFKKYWIILIEDAFMDPKEKQARGMFYMQESRVQFDSPWAECQVQNGGSPKTLLGATPNRPSRCFP